MFNTGYSKAVGLPSFVLLLVLMMLSYECAVYFLIKNVYYILGSVKVAEWQLQLLPLINFFSLKKIYVVLFIVFFRH